MSGRSRGAIALARLSVNQQVIADKLERSRAFISRVLSGEKTLSPEDRVVARDTWGIDPSWWDLSPEVPESSPKASSAAEVATLSREKRLATLNRLLQTMYAKLDDPQSTLDEQAKVLARLAHAELAIGKLTGEHLDMPEEKVVRLPAVRRVLETILTAVSAYPDALKVVHDELRKHTG